MNEAPLSSETQLNRTHRKSTNSFEERVRALKKGLISRGDLPHVTLQRQLEIVDQLCEFGFGRFIVERGGANGFWTDYLISYPMRGKLSLLNGEGKPFSPLEYWFLTECPVIIAHQERFHIFQSLLQKLLKEKIVLASIPCGLMRELITLDFSKLTHFEIVGIDIDVESLALAKELADENRIQNLHLMQKDAWQLSFNEEIDVITSSGLNVYEQDPEKVLVLYEKFFHALKPGGHLIISVLTYPPGATRETDWKIDAIPKETLLLDQILHKDILDIKWRNFRSSGELEREFKEVGFSEISIHFDTHHIFPTILAKKPG